MLGINIIDVVYLQNERDNENDENKGLHMYWYSFINNFDWRSLIMLKPNEMLPKWHFYMRCIYMSINILKNFSVPTTI